MATTGASLDPIYQRLNSTTVKTPVSANTFADWATEAGDRMTFTRDGKSYGTYVDSLVAVWRGKTPKISITSAGNEKRPAIERQSQRKYSRGSGAMRNQQGLYSDVWAEDGHVHSVISQTESRIDEYVEDTYNQMKAGLAITSSTLTAYVIDSYNHMAAGLQLTSSSLTASVIDSYNRMQSGLEMTSSSLSTYVRNSYTQMQAGLELTSDTLSAYVRSSYTQMQSGLALTSSSAALYTQGRTTRAYIMTRINADNEGEAIIEADKVQITGNTTISGTLEIDDGNLIMKKTAVGRGDLYLSTSGATIQASKHVVASGGHLRLIGTQSGEYYDLTATNIQGIIKKAEVSGNQLRLWTFTDNVSGNPSITFSKAITDWGYSWSTGQLTVVAYMNGQSAGSKSLLGVDVAGSWSGNTYNGRVVYWDGTDDETTYNTGRTFTLTGPGGDIDKDDIDIPNSSLAWYDSSSPAPSVDATLNNMGSLIVKNKQGYVYFNVHIQGTNVTKKYRIPVSTI